MLREIENKVRLGYGLSVSEDAAEAKLAQ